MQGNAECGHPDKLGFHIAYLTQEIYLLVMTARTVILCFYALRFYPKAEIKYDEKVDSCAKHFGHYDNQSDYF